MGTVNKSLKITLLTILAAAVAIGVIVGGFFLYAGQLRFICKDSADAQTGSVVIVSSNGMYAPGGMSANEMEAYFQKLEDEGYYTSSPIFVNNTDYGTVKYMDVYTSLLDGYKPYIYDMCQKYENRVKIDYTADIDEESKTITVSFTGYGYPEAGEPEVLDRDYIFDISGVDENNMPVLLTEYTYSENINKIFGI